MDYEVASFGIAGVAAISVLCFLAGLVVHISPIDDKWIPVICGVVGLFLGIVGMMIMDDYPASDFITAAAVGVVSGLAATGAHQIYKQLKKANQAESEVSDNKNI